MSTPANATLEQTLHHKFISACHILHLHRVLDAYGHISTRHPTTPGVFLMSRNIAPGIISSANDIIEYQVKDASPVNPAALKGYAERCIHSEIYRKYPSIHSVIHSHSEAVIPYSISEVPLKPCFHMAGFLGTSTPVFDISDYYKADDIKDLLVRNVHLGQALASHFSGSDSHIIDGQTIPRHNVVLMRGHGFTVISPNIEECVLRAIYCQQNAAIQTATLTISAAHNGSFNSLSSIKYLNEEEAVASTGMTHWSVMRPWNLWLREVESSGLYVNNE